MGVSITKEMRLVRYLGGLEQADEAEIAEAQYDYEQAVRELRVKKAHLADVERRCSQKREIRNIIVQDFALEDLELCCPNCGGDHDRISRKEAPECYDATHGRVVVRMTQHELAPTGLVW